MKLKLLVFAICSVIGLGNMAVAQQDTMMKNDSMKQTPMKKTETTMKQPTKRTHRTTRHHHHRKVKRIMGS